jgi:signal transduction histidine kinase
MRDMIKSQTPRALTNGTGKAPHRKKAASASALREDARDSLREALHDGLGQLLTTISFLAGSLRQKLAAQKLPEATEAAEILSLTGRAISETQALVSEQQPTPTEARRLVR